MCLSLLFSNIDEAEKAFLNPSIAQHDISCWKVLDIDTLHSRWYKSPYFGMQYEPGSHYVQPFSYSIFHNRDDETKFAWGAILKISEGLHSYSCAFKAHSIMIMQERSRIYVEVIIPKGSSYFHNPLSREYCSNELYFPHQEIIQISQADEN